MWGYMRVMENGNYYILWDHAYLLNTIRTFTAKLRLLGQTDHAGKQTGKQESAKYCLERE